MANFDFALKDGTVIRPRPRMKLLSPDGAKLLLCYGGLRVDGSSLMVQTAIHAGRRSLTIPDRDTAIAVLNDVRAAMDAGADSCELHGKAHTDILSEEKILINLKFVDTELTFPCIITLRFPNTGS